MRVLVSCVVTSAFVLSSACAMASDATATAAGPAERYALLVHGETHAQLFQRALLPGANGAVVAEETSVPVYQFVQLAARDLNIAREQRGLDLEFAAWWRGELAATSSERPSDGDVQTANVGYRRGPLSFRFGRQHVAGGAARYARLDGLVADSELGAGFDLRVYGGLTVLPRWNQRFSYTYLGAAADSNLRNPAVSRGRREREEYLLGGARLGFTAERARAALSFHEQHESEGLSRRTLTLDGTFDFAHGLSGGATASAELEAERLSEARAWLDAAPARALDLSFEWLHTEPALFLSRQSVLAVFSDAKYDEGGGRGALRPTDRITLEGGGWAELYSGSRPGARAEATLQVLTNRSRTAFARVTYARVLTPDNGYHSLRSSFSQRFLTYLAGTIEAYAYLYDHAIRSCRSSVVYSGTLEYRPSGAVAVLWGGSLVHSPYANLDAQTQVRLAYDFDFATIRGRR